METQKIFVTCSQGLEPLLAEELMELGFSRLSEGYRGVYVTIASLDAIYKINYCSRLAGRVLLPLAQFRCWDDRALYKGASEIEWSRYIPEGKTIAIDANVDHRKLRNSLFAAQVVKDAICDQLRTLRGSRPNVDPKSPDVQLNLFIRNEEATISFDTSGLSLHKRGYRLESGEAPLQESLAAALLRIAKYTGEEIMYDPCCGSGTLLIEAALIATRTAPGFLRKDWGFRYLPQFSMVDWLRVKAEADQFRIPLEKNKIFGCEVSKNTSRICKANLRAAGFFLQVEVYFDDFRNFTPPIIPNFVMTNPPHGRRLEDEERLVTLYRSLGDFLKLKMAKPARGFIFTGSLMLSKEVGLSASRRTVLDNSGIDSRLLEYDIWE